MNETMMNALAALFEKHRIVFWYCEDPLLVADFEACTMPTVEKRDITGHPLATKVEVLLERPKDKFLLFCRGTRPADEENFLIDVLLANAEFQTDKASLLATDLGLGSEATPVIKSCMGFFAAAKRVQELKSRLKDGGAENLEGLMLGIAAGVSGSGIERILMQLYKDKTGELARTIDRCGLTAYLWRAVRQAYGYESTDPSLDDFAMALFGEALRETCGRGKPGRLASAAFAFLSDWRDNARYAADFEMRSRAAEEAMEVGLKIAQVDWDAFGSADWFALIDKRIVAELAQRIGVRTVRHEDVARVVAERKQTHWQTRFSHHYAALEAASSFLSELAQTDFQPATADEAVRSYAETWSRLDGSYRRFVANAHEVRKTDDVLASLAEMMNGHYVNNCLLLMNQAFQRTLDGVTHWPFETGLPKAVDFWRDYVDGRMASKKVCVIISDALRYGVARDLQERFKSIDRYTARLEPMVGVLPSFTQLGMAALLPHDNLRFAIPLDGRVLVDGKSSAGIDERSAILSAAEPKGAEAVRAEEVLAWSKEELLSHQRKCRVLYVYHNVIDAMGDDRTTEHETCEACERAIDEIVALVKKLAGPSHISNFYVTADHGFLYQDSEVDDADFLPPVSTYDTPGACHLARRFFIGRGFELRTDLMRFEERQLGMSGDALVAIPKSIGKMRLKGAGSRYVHGGASLQEITVPLLTVTKSRGDDTVQVEVDILRDGIRKITTGIHTVKLYQMTPVGGKTLPRQLRISLKSKDGELLSPSKEVFIDSPSEASADRIVSIALPLNHKADAYDGQQVMLSVESRIGETTQYVSYKTESYQLKRSMIKDFD